MAWNMLSGTRPDRFLGDNHWWMMAQEKRSGNGHVPCGDARTIFVECIFGHFTAVLGLFFLVHCFASTAL
jgi:hypothetical protein